MSAAQGHVAWMSSVQDGVAQGFGLAWVRLPSRASSSSQASRVAAVRAAAYHPLFIASDSEGNLPMPQSFPVRMESSTLAWIR
jgi:hypothetical protein